MCGIRKQKSFKKYKSGVTLIELLIAISLAAVVGLTVLSAFSVGLQTFQKAQVLNGSQTDVLIAFEKIERDLRNIFAWPGIGFKVSGSTISFPGLINTADKDSGEGLVLGKISYTFDSSSRTLYREEMTYPQSLRGVKGAVEKLANVEYVTFDYFYQDPVTQRYGWKSFWDGEEMPLGVKVKITFKGIDENIEMARTVFLLS